MHHMAESTPESESANITTTITGLNGETMQLIMHWKGWRILLRLEPFDWDRKEREKERRKI